MDYKMLSVDDHLDLQYLPPDLWTYTGWRSRAGCEHSSTATWLGGYDR